MCGLKNNNRTQRTGAEGHSLPDVFVASATRFNARADAARKSRDQAEAQADGQKLVIDGARLRCTSCSTPEGVLKVAASTPTTQDKRTATILERDAASLQFRGNCLKSPNAAAPCATVMRLGNWQDTGTIRIQDQPPLLLRSTIACLYGGARISITDCGQRCEPGKLETRGAPLPDAHPFIPLVKIKEDDHRYSTELDTAETESLDLRIRPDLRPLANGRIRFKKAGKGRSLQFNVAIGSGAADDTDGGTITALLIDHTKSVIDRQVFFGKTYGDQLTVYLPEAEVEVIKFFANDVDSLLYADSNARLCGRLAIRRCWCNRNLLEDEFRSIIGTMRGADDIKSAAIFNAANCPLPADQKTYARVTEEYNKTFKKYHIDSCLQKLHFLAQTYWESDKFRTTVEYSDGKYLNPGVHRSARIMGNTNEGDGPRFKGRGLMQLTWRVNYKAYFKFLAQDPINANGLPLPIEFEADHIDETTSKYAKLLGENIAYAVDSAGWFWSQAGRIWFKNPERRKLNKEIAGKSPNVASVYGLKHTDAISVTVNGGSNGRQERKRYATLLYNNIFQIETHCDHYEPD